MKIHVSTFLNAPPDWVWKTVKTKELLFAIMSPLARFVLLAESPHGLWEEGKTYQGKSFALSFFPIGQREIFIEKIDETHRTIQSRERGEIGLQKWDHFIRVAPEGDGTRYTDSVEIQAGILTPFYWLFACVFYRHRQRMWRQLVNRTFP